jgi:adenine-specific DNA-methyltransferase
MLFYAKDISVAKINTLGPSSKKISQFVHSDRYGNYKLRAFRRSGNNSKREQRPGLYYPIYYEPSSNHISLEKGEGYLEILPVDEQGIERCWRWGKETLMERLDKYIEVKKTKKGFDLFIKEREGDYEGEKPKTIWDKPKYTGQTATNELKKLFGDRIFSYPKSHFLIMDVLKITTEKNDIVMDCFGGSGTTAHAVLELNKEDGGSRQFILCEQMDYVETVTRERVRKAIEQSKSGDFIYCELMKYNEAFMERIQAAKTGEELLQIWREMAEGSFLNWYVNPAMPEEAVNDFIALGNEPNGLEKQKRLLAELLDKNQLYVNLSEIDDTQFKVSKEDKALNKAFYGEAHNA